MGTQEEAGWCPPKIQCIQYSDVLLVKKQTKTKTILVSLEKKDLLEGERPCSWRQVEASLPM